MLNPHEIITDRTFKGYDDSNLLLELLTETRNFNRVKFINIEVNNISSSRMCFTYCVFTRTIFNSVDMQKLDLEGCVFIECEFIDAILNRCDAKTCKFVECIFTKCSFEGSFFTRNQFSSTTFNSVNLNNTVVLENISTNSKYVKCKTDQMTASLNEYVECFFEQYKFTVGTYAYQIMWKCNFESCVIGWATLGITYGLKKKDLEKFNLVHYFSELNDVSSDDTLKFIIERFQKSNNIYRALVLGINFGISRLSSLTKLLELIIASSNEENLPLRHEEILFFRLIIKYESEHRSIPLLVINNLLIKIENNLSQEWTDFNFLHSYLLHTEKLKKNELENEAHYFAIDRNIPVVVSLSYEEKPKMTLREFIDFLTSMSATNFQYDRYEEKAGSFIEIIYLSAQYLAGLLIILRLINSNLSAVEVFLEKTSEIKKKVSKLINSNSDRQLAKKPKSSRSITNINYDVLSININESSQNLLVHEIADDISNKIKTINLQVKEQAND